MSWLLHRFLIGGIARGFLVGLCLLICWSVACAARAQEEGEPVMQPAAKEAATPNTESSAEPDAEPVSPAQRSYLMWMIEASGPFGAMIFVCSFVMVALIVMNLL